MNGAVPPLVMVWTVTALPVYLFCAGSSWFEPCFALTVRGALSSSWSFFVRFTFGRTLPRVTYPRCVAIGSRQGIAAITSIPGTSISDGRMI